MTYIRKKIIEYDEKLNSNITDVLLFLYSKEMLDNLVICGSLGLYLNDKLSRKINDVDLLEIDCKYGLNPGNLALMYTTSCNSSSKFHAGDALIKCWKINIFHTNVDFLFNTKNEIEYDLMELTIPNIKNSLIVKVERPDSAYKFKELYAESIHNDEDRLKHRRDLETREPKKTAKYGTFFTESDDLPF